MKKYAPYILILLALACFFGTKTEALAEACNARNLFLATQGDIKWGSTEGASSDVLATPGSTVRLFVSGEDGCAGTSVTFQIVGGVTFSGTLKLGNLIATGKYQLYYDWTNNLSAGTYKFKTVSPASSGPSGNNLTVAASQPCNLSKVYANPNGGVQGETVQLTVEALGTCEGWGVTINTWDAVARRSVWSGSRQNFSATESKLVWNYTLPAVPTGAGQGVYYTEAHLGTQNLRSSTFIDCISASTCSVGGTVPPTPVPVPPSDGQYHFLAELPDTDGNIPKTFDPDEPNALGKYLNMMIRIFIGICAVLAVVMIVIGGMEYMLSELAHTKEHGKERITGAVLGLLVALGAYALLYTINPDLLKADLDSLTSVTLPLENQDIPQAPVAGRYGSYIEGAPWDTATAGPITVPPSGVGVNRTGDCTTIGQRPCTSLRGLSLSYITTIQTKCPACNLRITGGTETWMHSKNSSHRPGSPTIDLSIDANLTNYITGGAPPVRKRYTRDGISYLYETSPNHWHVGR